MMIFQRITCGRACRTGVIGTAAATGACIATAIATATRPTTRPIRPSTQDGLAHLGIIHTYFVDHIQKMLGIHG